MTVDPDSPDAPLGIPGPVRRGRRIRHGRPMLLGGLAFLVIALACGAALIGRRHAMDSNQKAEAVKAEPSSGDGALAGLQGSGQIPADSATPAVSAIPPPNIGGDARPAEPAAAATPAAAAQPGASPGQRQLTIEEEGRLARWRAYNAEVERRQRDRYDAAWAALKGSGGSTWQTGAAGGTAPQSGIGGGDSGAVTAQAADALAQAVLGGGAGMPGGRGGSRTPRPGWLNQGPSTAENAWLQGGFQTTPYRYAAMKGDTLQCRSRKAISSEIGGQFTATVTANLTDSAGNVLIPWGSTLVGSYDQNTGQGQERLPVGFTDIVLPPVGPQQRRDSFALGSMPGNDASGRAGFGGTVNRHTTRVLFSALVSALAGGAGGAAGQLAGGGAAASIAASSGASLGAAGQSIVGRGVNVASTIDVQHGYDCTVELTQHMDFPGRWVDGVGYVP